MAGGTVTGGGARPTANISISYNTYRPSNAPGRTGGSSGGGNSIVDSMDFTDFIVTPYDMQELEAKSAPTNQIYTPGKTIGAPLEDRMKMLGDTISGWQEVRDQLQNEYDGKYGKGIEFTNEDAMYNLFSVLNVLDVQGLLGVGHLMFLYTMDGPYLDEEFAGRVTDIVTEKGLLDKLQAYLNGASWEASGLADIYGADGENSFLYRLSEQCYSLELDERYYVDDYNNMDPEFIKNGYAELFHINDLNQEYNPYQTFDEITNKVADARTLETDINTVNSQLYQLEQLQKLLPFTYVVDNSDFGNYMERDYASDSNIPNRLKENMSQEELAIYIYLLEHNGKDKANEYIDAMEDQINQRIGMREAIEYIESMSENGFDAGDLFKSAGVGFGDGTQNFFDGLKDFFMADGVMSAFEYEIMFKVSLLANGENEYNLNLTEAERQILAFNYQSWQSIGNMWIPSALSFIPVVGKPLSSSLLFMSSSGNATEGAMQQGADAFHAYLYGCMSGLSEVAFERMLGGIPGLSNMGESFLMNCLSEGREEFLQEWIDAGLRYAILGEPINLDETMNNSLYAALQGMAVSGLMQGGQKITFSIGGSILTLSGVDCETLTQLVSSLDVDANGNVPDSKVLDAIMNLDDSNPLKQQLIESLNLELETNQDLENKADGEPTTPLDDTTPGSETLPEHPEIAGAPTPTDAELSTEFEALKNDPDLKGMNDVELERYLNELTNGAFSDRIDAWQEATYKYNVSNAYWDARVELVKSLIRTYGYTNLKAKDFVTDDGINYYKLAQEIQKRDRTRPTYEIAEEVWDYLQRNPVTVDTKLLYAKSIEECMIAEQILMERYKNGDIKDIAKALDYMVVDKKTLRYTYGITDYMTSADIKNSDLYKLYMDEVLSQTRYDQVLREMVPDGVSGRVFNVQTISVFEGYTLDSDKGAGSLGRKEGYYVISESKVIDALSKATGQTITSADVDNILQGNGSGYKIDMSVLETELGFPKDYLSGGAYLVQSTATPDSLRASIPTDQGANPYYLPGMQTSGNSNEMLNEQQTDLRFQQNENGAYYDPEHGISAGKL